jgi:hypothetical protein
MKVLVAVSHPGFLRNFESGIRHLLLRGHRVHILLGKAADPGSVTGTALQVLARVDPGNGALTSSVVRAATNEWSVLAADLRAARDYWRYLQPDYNDATLLRGRARAEAPAFAVWLESLLRIGSCRRAVDAIVHGAERRLPVPDATGAVLDDFRPDVVAVTPLLYFRSDQVDLVRAARVRSLPVVYASGSWDHLTTKGLLHEAPDLALVWNDSQIEELVTLHGFDRARCRATGAQAFDHWFERRPAMDRAAFCAQVGLPSDRPFLLYLCSSVFIAGDERPAVREWMAALRSASDPIRSAAVLIRPHPQNASQWQQEKFENNLTAVWPKEGANPVGEAARADFFHSIYFSDGVVGVNTSAQIEAAIVGRPVFSVLSDRYIGTQSGTLHFRHLQKAGGGLLHTASSLAEHVRQLGAVLGSLSNDERAARFVKAFVRPSGPRIQAGEVFAKEVEQAIAGQPAVPDDWRAALTRRLLRGLAVAAENARRLRATSASPRFQAWFLPSAETFRTAHMDPAHGRRIAWVAASVEEVEQLIPVSIALAERRIRMLLCMPDGAPGAASKALIAQLERCVTVGLPEGSAQSKLVLRKFRAERLVSFERSAATPIVARAEAAARAMGIPAVRLKGDRGAAPSMEQVQRLLGEAVL